MDSSQPKDLHSASRFSSLASSATYDTSTSHYLKVPSTKPLRPSANSDKSDSDRYIDTNLGSTSGTTTPIVGPFRASKPAHLSVALIPQIREQDLSKRTYMSITSASSVDTDFSVCSSPPAKSYRVPRFQRMSETRRITEAEKQQYIHALQTHQLNTLVDLRRVEKAFAVLGTPDCSQSMTSAWSYYVNSNGLLTELRGLTKNYPFSSDCLDEAKRRVFSDPESNRSWNLCWLLLSKIENDQLISHYARHQASLPAMWGQHKPSSEDISRLAAAFQAEWSYAVSQFLRHWEQPPTV